MMHVVCMQYLRDYSKSVLKCQSSVLVSHVMAVEEAEQTSVPLSVCWLMQVNH